jgi:hypothetical protein
MRGDIYGKLADREGYTRRQGRALRDVAVALNDFEDATT